MTTTQHDIASLRTSLSRHLAEQRQTHFGSVSDAWVTYAEHRFWDGSCQNFRLQDLAWHGFLPGNCKVLDMAAGCGQFVEHALENGYDCFGVEPEPWKIAFALEKFRTQSRPEDWDAHVVPGYGETLPFDDDTFDCVTSYQTLEHVQDPQRVLQEMLRVTRVGGGIHIRCPDYRSTFEAHYQLPWLPLFPRMLAKGYLRLLGRPTAGLDTIQYITRPALLRWITAMEARGYHLQVTDDNRVGFENKMRRIGLGYLAGGYGVWRLFKYCGYLFRRELSVNLFIRVLGK
jgi:ubiquinone/menaquinone biosynthesis C-methylase UbiE